MAAWAPLTKRARPPTRRSGVPPNSAIHAGQNKIRTSKERVLEYVSPLTEYRRGSIDSIINHTVLYSLSDREELKIEGNIVIKDLMVERIDHNEIIRMW